jgi:V/A-type H+-transporting ATPase subunit G/H
MSNPSDDSPQAMNPKSIYTEIRISKVGVAGMGKAEILIDIKKAEEKVRAMSLDAEDKRKQLQAEGKRRALAIVDAAEASMRAEGDAKLAKAKADINVRKRVIMDEGAKKASVLAAEARQRMRNAKEFVLSEFERAADA